MGGCTGQWNDEDGGQPIGDDTVLIEFNPVINYPTPVQQAASHNSLDLLVHANQSSESAISVPPPHCLLVITFAAAAVICLIELKFDSILLHFPFAFCLSVQIFALHCDWRTNGPCSFGAIRLRSALNGWCPGPSTIRLLDGWLLFRAVYCHHFNVNVQFDVTDL